MKKGGGVPIKINTTKNLRYGVLYTAHHVILESAIRILIIKIYEVIIIYRDIKGFSKYEINEYGSIRNKSTHKELKSRINRNGYYQIKLYDDNMYQATVNVHRLVAITFCNGYKEGLVVNHIDGNKLNNHYSNLEWVTISENTKHAYDNNLGNMQEIQLRAAKMGANKHHMIIDVYKDGKFLDTYNSKIECANALNVNAKTVYNWINGKTKDTKGYTLVIRGGGAHA